MLTLLLSLTASADPVSKEIHITHTMRSTPLFRADLDEDGEVEQISVSFSPTLEVIVTVYEPAGGIVRLNLGTFEDFSGVSEDLYASLSDPDQTGVPLLEVRLPAAEQCGSWERHNYISYRAPEPGVPGSVKRAIEVINGGDSPVYTDQSVVFDPDNRTVRLTVANGDDTGETTTITHHAFIDGVYETTSKKQTHQTF